MTAGPGQHGHWAQIVEPRSALALAQIVEPRPTLASPDQHGHGAAGQGSHLVWWEHLVLSRHLHTLDWLREQSVEASMKVVNQHLALQALGGEEEWG